MGLKRAKSGEKRQKKTVTRKKAYSHEDDGTQMEHPIKKRGKPVFRRKHLEKDKFDSPMANKVLRQFCLEAVKVRVPGLMKQFNSLRDIREIPPKVAFDSNVDKNRYRDVFCIDKTRVVLKWPPGNKNDYIHANWVPVKDKKKYICTQAPKPETIDDFWRMVWQERAPAIVMLCGLTELGKVKCEQYWPDQVGTTADAPCGLTIKNLSISNPQPQLFVTKLELTYKKEKFITDHLYWRGWPDRGVPRDFLSAFRLLVQLKDYFPIVIHCSAGIGRTGTIVGLDICQAAMCEGEPFNMLDVVKELRDSRHGSVQTDIQFVYMHRAFMTLAENRKIVTREELATFYRDYEILAAARGSK